MLSFPRAWTSPEPSLSTQLKGEAACQQFKSAAFGFLQYSFIRATISLNALSNHLVCRPACSYLFWTEWGQYPRIERSRLDGTQRLVLVNVSISWPNGISIDYEVWTTASKKMLTIINVSGLCHWPDFLLCNNALWIHKLNLDCNL